MASERCPACSALARPEALWCSLCYAQLGPGASGYVAADEVAADAPATAAVALTGPRGAVGQRAAAQRPAANGEAAHREAADGEAARPKQPGGWPCARCEQVNALGADVCAACGSTFLSGLRSERPRLALPGVGDVAGLGRAARLTLGLALAVLALLAGFVLLTGVSALL